jgi:hypothetical protein
MDKAAVAALNTSEEENGFIRTEKEEKSKKTIQSPALRLLLLPNARITLRSIHSEDHSRIALKIKGPPRNGTRTMARMRLGQQHRLGLSSGSHSISVSSWGSSARSSRDHIPSCCNLTI